MKKIKMLSICLIILGTFLASGLFFVARAQEDEGTGEVVDPSSVFNISNARITSWQDNNFKVSFKLNGGEKGQEGIKYGISLRKKIGEKWISWDEKSFDEIVNLKAKESVEMEVEYSSLKYLKGNFQIWVSAMTIKGIPLSNVMAAEVELNGTGNFVEMNSIDPQKCYLKIKNGDKIEDKKFNLKEGVAIEKEKEDLIFFCEVTNNFNEDSFHPIFKTYYRSTFGDLVSEKKGEGIISLSKDGKPKEISFAIPKVSKPQAYDVEITLADSSGNTVSNSIVAHYVLSGQSATIQKIGLDKSSYVKDENAKISFKFTGSADSFPGSRFKDADYGNLFLETLVLDKNGGKCSDIFKKELKKEDGGGDLKFDIPVTKNCSNALAGAVLKDSGGKILDEFNYKIKEDSSVLTEGKKTAMSYLIIGFVFLLFAFLIILVWKLRNGNNKIGTIVIICFFAVSLAFLMVPGERAKAVMTFGNAASCVGWNSWNFETWIWNSLNPSSASYAPGQVVNTYSYSDSINYWCNNRSDVPRTWLDRRIERYNGSSWVAVDSWTSIFDCPQGWVALNGSCNGSRNFTASSTAGSYRVAFRGNAQFSWIECIQQQVYDPITGAVSWDNVCTPRSCNTITRYEYFPFTVPNITYHTLTAAINPAGSGTIVSTGASGSVSGITCPGDCSESYAGGSSVTLIASPNSGYSFSSWSGCDIVGGNSCIVTMNSARSVTANFSSIAYSCTGTIPSNASIYSGDDTGLIANTPYTYSATNTVTKCQYSCITGYAWNGSSCVVTPAPTLIFTASPNPVSSGSASNLSWTTTNANACWATGSWTDWKSSTGGSESTGALTAASTYFLECWNTAGVSSGIRSVTVNVSAPAYSCTGTLPSNASIYSGDDTGLIANTPYTYSATNTVTKCQYSCITGYAWNGSSCICNPSSNCAPDTCEGTQCNNGCYMVDGTKRCEGEPPYIETKP